MTDNTTKLIERMQVEADLCRNDGADDIARMLDEAVSDMSRQAGEIERLRADAARLTQDLKSCQQNR